MNERNGHSKRSEAYDSKNDLLVLMRRQRCNKQEKARFSTRTDMIFLRLSYRLDHTVTYAVNNAVVRWLLVMTAAEKGHL